MWHQTDRHVLWLRMLKLLSHLICSSELQWYVTVTQLILGTRNRTAHFLCHMETLHHWVVPSASKQCQSHRRLRDSSESKWPLVNYVNAIMFCTEKKGEKKRKYWKTTKRVYAIISRAARGLLMTTNFHFSFFEKSFWRVGVNKSSMSCEVKYLRKTLYGLWTSTNTFMTYSTLNVFRAVHANT